MSEEWGWAFEDLCFFLKYARKTCQDKITQSSVQTIASLLSCWMYKELISLRTLWRNNVASASFSDCEVRIFFFPPGSVCESKRQALLAANYNPCHRHEQKYILKTSISSLSFECQWELKIAWMSCRFAPGSVMFDADAPQISIFCAAVSISAHDTFFFFLFYFFRIYLSPPFLSISYLTPIGPSAMHTS